MNNTGFDLQKVKNRKFILCIGASKSGTTWFYNLLKNQSNFSKGLRKEYNALSKIFHTKHIYVSPPKVSGNTTLAQKIFEVDAKIQDLSNSVEKYCEYFDNITPQGCMSADISPSYIALTTEHIEEVCEQFLDRGFECNVALFLRDPIERIYSFSNMIMRNRRLCKHLGVTKESSLNDVALLLSNHPEFTTDYAAAIDSIENSNFVSKKFIYPYEALTTAAGLAAVSLCFELERLEGFENEVFHKGNKIGFLGNNKVLLQLRNSLADQYDYCEKYFRSKKIHVNWRHM
jgi:hypothetical protein